MLIQRWASTFLNILSVDILVEKWVENVTNWDYLGIIVSDNNDQLKINLNTTIQPKINQV